MRRHWLTWLGVALALALPHTALAEDDVLLVIVHPDNPKTNITLEELRQIYLRHDTAWPDGTSIMPLNVKAGTAERTAFDEKVLGMDPNAVGTHWVDQKIRGGASPPKQIGSVLLLQRVVGQREEAIGYVRLKQRTPGTKVLTVDGKTHTDPSYPLTL